MSSGHWQHPRFSFGWLTGLGQVSAKVCFKSEECVKPFFRCACLLFPSNSVSACQNLVSLHKTRQKNALCEQTLTVLAHVPQSSSSHLGYNVAEISKSEGEGKREISKSGAHDAESSARGCGTKKGRKKCKNKKDRIYLNLINFKQQAALMFSNTQPVCEKKREKLALFLLWSGVNYHSEEHLQLVTSLKKKKTAQTKMPLHNKVSHLEAGIHHAKKDLCTTNWSLDKMISKSCFYSLWKARAIWSMILSLED